MQIDLLIQRQKEICPNQKISTNTYGLCFTFMLSLLTPPLFPFFSLLLLPPRSPDFRQSIKISLFHREVEEKGKWVQTEREQEFDTDSEIYLCSKFGL